VSIKNKRTDTEVKFATMIALTELGGVAEQEELYKKHLIILRQCPELQDLLNRASEIGFSEKQIELLLD